MVDRRVIQDLVDRVKIEEVVSRYVTLKRSGSSLRGLCPFHNETSPSFYVSPSKGFYYCFGCRSGGNVVKFLQEIEGKSFIEVIRELAEREGVPLPSEVLDEGFEKKEKERYARHRRQIELLKAAASTYEKYLWKSSHGEKARRYLERRDVSGETAGRFRLGFAPEGGIDVPALVRSMKASPQDAVDVGLLRHGRDGGFYELFRGRLMFPIIIPGGNIVGFSGRALPGTREEEKVKYLNSPDTEYFHKSDILFGMAQALGAVRRSGSVILVEGNFDLLAMVQAGLENTAAPLGSALTSRQVEYVKRLSAGIVLLFDGDEGGVRAAHKAFEVVVPYGLDVKIALLPENEDPHSFLSSAGKYAMEKVLAGAVDMAGYIIGQRAGRARGSDVERAKALRGLWDVLRKTPDDLVRGEMLKKLPQAFGMSEREVKDALGFREGRRPDPVGDSGSAERAGLKREYEILLGAVADFPSIASEIYTRSRDVLEDDTVRRILHEIASTAGEESSDEREIDVVGISSGIQDEHVRDWFMRRMVGETDTFKDEAEARRAALDSLGKLEKEMIGREIRSKSSAAREAREKGDEDAYMKVLAEQQKLRRKAKKIVF